MKIRMLRSQPGAANAHGSRAMLYEQDRDYDMAEPWQRELAALFVRERWARPLGVMQRDEAPRKRRQTKPGGS